MTPHGFVRQPGGMTPFDIGALVLFAVAWLGYDPLMRLVTAGRGSLNRDMETVRVVWMRRMLEREVRIADTNIIGQLLNSASFFASTNILIIAAAAGVLFGGQDMLSRIEGLASFAQGTPLWLVEAKVALVIVTLARGLLSFIWAIRQINYCLAMVGAAPELGKAHDGEAYADASAALLNAAVGTFNQGVRGYYFSLAAAAWLATPWAMAAAAVGAFALLVWRQTHSRAAGAVRRLHDYFRDEAG